MEKSTYFSIALPDTDAADFVHRRLIDDVNIIIKHPSGRPWLLARVPDHVPFVHAHSSRGMSTVVIGPTDADETKLEIELRAVRSPRDLIGVPRRFNGSFVPMGAVNGSIYASGPALETRRVFYAKINGVYFAADRADVLAGLGDFSLDFTAIAMRLARGLPHPVDDVPLWHGIENISGSEHIAISANGDRVERHTWWHRPSMSLTRQEGAEQFRAAMESAVDLRSSWHAGPIACDLSGGLDSTPLCYFASQDPEGVIAQTMYTNDPGGHEDLEWSRRALPAMPGVVHHDIFSTDQFPSFYEGFDRYNVPVDDPNQAVATIPRLLPMLSNDVERGTKIHLTGLGGDHLLRGVKSWNHTIARQHPVRGLARARAEDAAVEVGILTTLRQLGDRRTYRQWYQDSLRTAMKQAEQPELPRTNDCSVPLAFPDWLMPEATAAIHDRMRKAGENVTALGENMAEHFDLFSVRQAGRLSRVMGLIADSVGISYDSPLLDDKVVESVFSVRYEERDTPIEWKPLMKSAMKGLLPDEYLRRKNKVGGAPQSVRGYRSQYRSLQELWESSGILDAGIIDKDKLFAAARPSAMQQASNHVLSLVNAAIFVRAWESRNSRERAQLKGQP